MVRRYNRTPEEDRLAGIEICERYGVDPIDVKGIMVTPLWVKFYVYERDEEGFIIASRRGIARLRTVRKWKGWGD